MLETWLKPLALVAAGAVVGAAASLLVANGRAPVAKQALDAKSSPNPPSKEGTQLSQLEARLRQVEGQSRTVPTSSTARTLPSAEPPIASPDDAPEAQKAAFWQSVRDSVMAHNAEPVDPSWSAKTAAYFNADLSNLAATHHFKVASLDCRTTTCLAKIEWPSTVEANQEYSDLLHSAYKANCTKRVVLDEAPTRSGTHEATLNFDCESWRGDGEPVFDTGSPR